jgi:rhodanese-related sulfurtransferase
MLGGAALVLGAVAAVSGKKESSGYIDIAALASTVAREDDHVTAVELAEWIRARRSGLRVIDLRSEAEYDSLHIPGAERLEIDTIARVRFKSGETVVLYSDAGAHSAQAWVFLRALGYREVFFLRGGVQEWLSEVISPALVVDPTDAERERFATSSALSRYFGGTPRVGVSRGEQTETIARVKRRGC